jgi:hypothetical protein
MIKRIILPLVLGCALAACQTTKSKSCPPSKQCPMKKSMHGSADHEEMHDSMHHGKKKTM